MLCEQLPSLVDYLLICPSLDALVLVECMAKKLNLNWDFLIQAPIISPKNPDCELGRVSETKDFIYDKKLSESFGISDNFIYSEIDRVYEEQILPDVYKLRGGQKIATVQNYLIVDQGANVGAVAVLAAKSLFSVGALNISYAAPVVSMDAYELLDEMLDNCYCARKIEAFLEVQNYYAQDEPLDLALLKDSKHFVLNKK